MQCRDIPARPILVRLFGLAMVSAGATAGQLIDAMPAHTPPRLAQAKMKRLARAGLVGEWRETYFITPAGQEFLETPTNW